MATLSEPLADLFWREEIAELLFWRELCGLGATATHEDVHRLAAARPDPDRPAPDPGRPPPEAAHAVPGQGLLDRQVAEGLLERTGEGYSLTAAGRSLGARLFVADPELPPLRTLLTRPHRLADHTDALRELKRAIDTRVNELEARRP